ncbi:hypothetical protein H632_c5560p0 [Helicosporidium sp. ATCC 50920]|nr:hypothetical protein H632_c5560p0 [Helicosporidium sp. ATCC 50920]|eukprot:KDD71207.1 hypothetical protein H632_c5560p0 [Helicosporidium sp. ATCC 50920]
MDLEQKSKADAWKTFAAGKGSKKRTGFMTGHKKESIFKVPEGGKVGVVGSGQGMTDYKKQKRHDFGSM